MSSANSEGAWAIAQFAVLLNAGAVAQKEPATTPRYNMADLARAPILTVAPTQASLYFSPRPLASDISHTRSRRGGAD
jgi:hypothetical protein